MPQKITPLNIRDSEVYRMAKELSERTGESMTMIVRKALREKFDREKRSAPEFLLLDKLKEIADRCAARPVLDPRSDDEIIGYDERGLPR